MNKIRKYYDYRYYFPILQQTRRNISALYLSGDKAKESYAVLTPFMEFDKKFKDNNLGKTLSRRKADINAEEIQRKYEVFKSMKEEISQLEARRQDIAKALRESETEDVADSNNLKKEGKDVRDKLKLLKKEFYPIEADFITAFLNLPNDLHGKTPSEHAKLLYRKGLPEHLEAKNCIPHLEHKDLIDFTSQSSYYLLKEAATFDLEFPYYCLKHFLDNDFTLMTNPDFGRSILVEAALIDKTTICEVVEETDQSKINALHLAGGGSLIGFLGYVAKLSVFPSTIPLRLISSGRKYSRISDNSLKGLYAALQTNAVQAFVASKNSDEADHEIDNVLNLVVDIYKELDINFRIEFLPADKLLMAESLRASIQVYSPVCQDYIEVGHFSHYKDFISKRLLFNIRNNKDVIFPHIVAGTIVDVTKLIACLLENGKKLSIPSDLKNSLYKFKNFVS